MRWMALSASPALLALTIFVAPIPAAQNQSGGVILQAEKARLGSSPVTAGASVFSGDVLFTDSEGRAQVLIDQTRFELTPDTEVALFSTEKGPVAELRHGSVIVSNNSASEAFRIYASDVLVVPTTDRPVLGQVTLNSPCEVTVASEHGKLEATAGRETKTIEEAHSYRVRPEYSVRDTRMPGISPDDDAFHRGHNHTTCAAAPQQHAMKGPVAPGSSHFTLLVGAVVGVITGIGVGKALESPDRP